MLGKNGVVTISPGDSMSKACAALAEGAGAKAFSVGKGPKKNRCWAETLPIDSKLASSMKQNKKSPPCPAQGGWKQDDTDFYLVVEAGDYYY